MRDYYSPSIFELVSCDKLKNGLREALRYLLENLSQVDSIRRLPIPPPDESILILDIFIEYNYLRTYNASYAENLFNLVRQSRATGAKSDKLLASLFCVALVPYMRRKIDKYFEDLNYKETRSADELRMIRVYKLLSKSCAFVDLICLLRYSAGKSSYHSVLNGILNTCLMGRVEDIQDDDPSHTRSLADNVSRHIADVTGRALTIGSYIIQFLDYWNTHTNSAPLLSASLPIPDPPSKEGLAYADEGSSNLCLICLHVRQNECALSNTGYVFCYKCLHRYVTTKRRCPVTGQPTTVDNIVKLFTSGPS